jgi:hypothetical protein
LQAEYRSRVFDGIYVGSQSMERVKTTRRRIGRPDGIALYFDVLTPVGTTADLAGCFYREHFVAGRFSSMAMVCAPENSLAMFSE